MKEISYTEARILKDILEEIETEGINIYEITNDKYLEFGINWSAFGTQSIEKTGSFINDLHRAIDIAKKINNLKLSVNYDKKEIFNNKGDYLKKKAELEKEYIG